MVTAQRNQFSQLKGWLSLKTKKFYIYICASQPNSTYEMMPLWKIQTPLLSILIIIILKSSKIILNGLVLKGFQNLPTIGKQVNQGFRVCFFIIFQMQLFANSLNFFFLGNLLNWERQSNFNRDHEYQQVNFRKISFMISAEHHQIYQ